MSAFVPQYTPAKPAPFNPLLFGRPPTNPDGSYPGTATTPPHSVRAHLPAGGGDVGCDEYGDDLGTLFGMTGNISEQGFAPARNQLYGDYMNRQELGLND